MGVAISTPTNHKCPRIELASIRSDTTPIQRFKALFVIITLKEAAIVRHRLWKIQIQKLDTGYGRSRFRNWIQVMEDPDSEIEVLNSLTF
jgi:hypothetical protein